MKQIYTFEAKVWVYDGPAAWHFITMPKDVAKNIDFYFHHAKRGWGSLPVTVTLGATIWKTSIFPDKEAESYMLPLKAEVRKKENIKAGDLINFILDIEG